METVRAFFAVALCESARAAAASVIDALRERDRKHGVRFVRQESLHVTLRFLGDVPVARLGELVAAVTKEVAPLPAFALSLGSLVGFPTARRPRVLALEVSPAEALVQAAAAVERGVVAVGFPPEDRPFRAHLTLGRVKGAPPDLAGVVTPPHEPSAVDAVVLLQSELSSDGARYTPLERVPLGGPVPSEPRL